MFANNVLLGFALMSVKINKSPTIEECSFWKSDEVQRRPDALIELLYPVVETKRKALDLTTHLSFQTICFCIDQTQNRGTDKHFSFSVMRLKTYSKITKLALSLSLCHEIPIR